MKMVYELHTFLCLLFNWVPYTQIVRNWPILWASNFIYWFKPKWIPIHATIDCMKMFYELKTLEKSFQVQMNTQTHNQSSNGSVL